MTGDIDVTFTSCTDPPRSNNKAWPLLVVPARPLDPVFRACFASKTLARIRPRWRFCAHQEVRRRRSARSIQPTGTWQLPHPLMPTTTLPLLACGIIQTQAIDPSDQCATHGMRIRRKDWPVLRDTNHDRARHLDDRKTARLARVTYPDLAGYRSVTAINPSNARSPRSQRRNRMGRAPKSAT